ncbi:hypothetical protein FEM48_Zijuj08G0097700 [Ziziphus jujuba var. spinosa]|uniref:Phosphatidic acid phosphatase type 2/haloperoxidase domain-containing protein n=1 Tax=Ziziphus jujuba var. spinosa TaxID=714518 RepID=A0A978UYD9_ZIZJJ|nr:hypothetical protein FEM48_Zijuj08G0097700 [Ziziphus jujuba var. spinosa]
MFAPTSCYFRPSLKFFSDHSCSSRFKSLKSLCSSRFRTSKLVFSSEFVPKKGLLGTNRFLGSKNMVEFELIKTSGFGNSNGEEGVRVLEQEELIDGSSEFRSGLRSVGLESTLNRLSKWLVSALFAAVILGRHDTEALWAAMGSIVNAMLSVALKRILNQERPVATLRSDPGMPSSHAQSIFYTVMFVVLSIVEWLGINEISLTISGFALVFGSYFSWLRVSQQLHTINQVVVGAVLGSLFSIFWYWSWNSIVEEAFLSSLWVQIFVVSVAAAFCIGFMYYVFKNWFHDE